jgi:hypothetical protein
MKKIKIKLWGMKFKQNLISGRTKEYQKNKNKIWYKKN